MASFALKCVASVFEGMAAASGLDMIFSVIRNDEEKWKKSEKTFLTTAGIAVSATGAAFLLKKNNKRNLRNSGFNPLFIFIADDDDDDDVYLETPHLAIGMPQRINDINSYYNRKINHKNDSQNSHDISVNAAKKEIITRLRIEQENVKLVDVKDIIKEINANDDFTSRQLKEKQELLKFQTKTAAEYINSKCEYSRSADATDYETLRCVWTRANDPLNSENAQKIRQAVFDALVDLLGRTFQ